VAIEPLQLSRVDEDVIDDEEEVKDEEEEE
jgi:hypothetical protein